ncbi:MAG: septum formation protein Maf [Lentisphaeria bacterium]|nr:septum formation protein Maf [Lentisphaeria bacterium]
MTSRQHKFKEIILASKSPRRAELLKKHGVPFVVCVSDADELTSCANLPELPVLNAELKCAAVADIHPGKTVVGADTVIFFENMILGKPADEKDAVRMLKLLSGKTHQVITGCAVICRTGNFIRKFKCVSNVKFRTLDDEKIKSYISKVNVLDKAGAYAIQEYGDDIIQEYSGSLDNIIGLPVDELCEVLAEIQ